MVASPAPRQALPGLPRRQAAGMILVLLLLMAGRLVRERVLLGPEGRWRDDLWFADLLAEPETGGEDQAERPRRPKLTSPLPVNTCGTDSLTLLPGVGSVLAERMAAARAGGLVFRSPADLRRVKGIGPTLSARLAPLVIFATESAADSGASAVPARKSP